MSGPPPEAYGDHATLPPRPMPPSQPGPASRGSPAWTAIAAGVALGRSRLAAGSTIVAAALGLGLSIAGALIERSVGTAGAVDRALAGTFGLVVPLLSFWIVRVATARARLGDAAWPAARFGLPRREVALGIMLIAALAAASLSALSAAVAVVIAHSPSAPPIGGDALLSAWIGALTAAAYVGWFSFGATFLRRGEGSAIVLLLDFVAGGSTSVAGALLPRGNAANLLGGAAPAGLTQPSSTAILIASAFAFSLAAALRSGE